MVAGSEYLSQLSILFGLLVSLSLSEDLFHYIASIEKSTYKARTKSNLKTKIYFRSAGYQNFGYTFHETISSNGEKIKLILMFPILLTFPSLNVC